MNRVRLLAFALGLLAPGLAHAGEIVRDLQAPSAALGRDLGYALYRPDGARGPLPTVYLLHGRNSTAAEWLEMGKVAQTADRLIAEGRVPPFMLVLPDSGNSWYAGAMAAAIAVDLPAAIEARHGAIAARGGRALAGKSMGGFGAVGIALAYPERFAAAASMSGAFWMTLDEDKPLDAVMQARVARVFEGAFGAPFQRATFLKHSPYALAGAFPMGPVKPAIHLISGAQDRFGLTDQSRMMLDVLRAKNFDVAFETLPGDHEWGTWERSLPRTLEFIARRWER
ncbi:MAG: alpha/beta hydrolase-fold protein [Tagaea sp.]|nr:alpha/beta hydrolase-fold protein [Tagaea sp.]